MLSTIKKLFARKYESLPGDAFKQLYRSTQSAVLIDVRTPGEFSGGTIRGARNINFMSPAFASTVQNLAKEKTYFLFCRSGARSSSACSHMSKLGFKVYNLAGGIGSWRD